MAFSLNTHLYFLSDGGKNPRYIFVVGVVGVRYSSCTDKAVLLSQHVNMPVPISFSPVGINNVD